MRWHYPYFLLYPLVAIFSVIVPAVIQSEEEGDLTFFELIEKGECFFDSENYGEAIACYRRALDQVPSEKKEQISSLNYRIAQIYYHIENYTEVTHILKEEEKFSPAMLLTGMAYEKLGNLEHAISAWEHVLQPGSKNRDSDEAHWRLGLAFAKKKEFRRAKLYWEQLTPEAQPKKLYFLSQLHMARTEIEESELKKAEDRLHALFPLLLSSDPLVYEYAYLMGVIFLKRQDYLKASFYLEKAIPKQRENHATWYPQVLELLGHCYVSLAQSLEGATQEARLQKRVFFEKAEATLLKLIKINPQESWVLLLGRCYLSKGQLLDESDAFNQLEELLKSYQNPEALFLRAQAASSYENRDKLYRKLIQATDVKNPYYIKGWHGKGLNDLEEGQRLKRGGAFSEAIGVLDQSIGAFKIVFNLSEKENRELAAAALIYQIQGCLSVDSKDYYRKALEISESFLVEHEELFCHLKDVAELYFLRGLAASSLNDAEDVALAQEIWEKAVKDFPTSCWVPQILYSLATLNFQQKYYAQAEEIFLNIAQNYSRSSVAGDSLFFASRCEEMQKKSLEKIKEYRRRVFEEYPESLYAAEAYLTYYPYADYLYGPPSVIQHLQAMPTLFPSSPYLIHAYYLLGLNIKKERKNADEKFSYKHNLNKAIEAFHDSESIFDSLQAKGLIPMEQLEYFSAIRYKAVIERALTNLSIGMDSVGTKRQIFLEYAADVFKQIVQEFEDSNHPITSILKQGQAYPTLCEESEYGLAQVYMKWGNEEQATKVFTRMLEKYQGANITKGYYLSRSWYDRGLMAQKNGDYAEALEYFLKSEDCGKGRVLSADQKLDLWIQQSHCYRAMHQLEAAMRILSQVINDNVISVLRLKAMFLRAEIYEEQGREELAMKQLEALTKKGSEWAVKAKEKLEKDYGY